VIAGDICCQKKQTEPILVEGEWSYDDFKMDTFTVMYDREGANGLNMNKNNVCSVELRKEAVNSILGAGTVLCLYK
jgi:hypothetical protein